MQWFTVCLLVSGHDSTLPVILLSKQYQNEMITCKHFVATHAYYTSIFCSRKKIFLLSCVSPLFPICCNCPGKASANLSFIVFPPGHFPYCFSQPWLLLIPPLACCIPFPSEFGFQIFNTTLLCLPCSYHFTVQSFNTVICFSFVLRLH